MNTEELIGATIWLDREVKSQRILQNYSELYSRLQSTANGSPQSFGDQRDQLVVKLRAVNLLLLTNEQRDFLSRLNLIDHLGSAGAAELEDALFKNSIDPVTAAAKVASIISDIQQAVDRSDQIKNSLSGLIEVKKELTEEALIRVTFDGQASIKDVSDLKKWATEWHDIGRGIAMAVGATPKDIKVVGAQKGSIIIELATAYGIAQVIATTLLKALEVAEKVISIRKMALEADNLKLNNALLLEQIKTAAEKANTDGLETITNEVKVGIGRQLNGEEQKALDNAVKKLLSFVQKGGEVDVVLPIEIFDSSDDEEVDFATEKMKSLRADIHRIRALEAGIKAIDYQPQSEGN